MIDALSQGLALIARPLFQQTGDDGRQQVLQACREAIAQKGSHLSTKVFRVLQFAKGFEFSAVSRCRHTRQHNARQVAPAVPNCSP